MRRIILIVAVLMFAAPAWATTTVDIGCTVGGTDGNEVTVSYNVVPDPNRVRAFALDITTFTPYGDANIVEVIPYKVGESNSVRKGYGIFPGTIDINDTTGEVDSYGTPVAPSSDPGAGGTGIDTNEIIVELGSLYVDNNAPDDTGELLKFYVDKKGCDVNIAVESAIRGGVVLEDPDAAVTVNCTDCLPCFIVGAKIGDTVVTPTMYATWVAKGKPKCWCYHCFDRGDSNGDCVITSTDILAVVAAWPPKPYHPCADFNRDGVITSTDILTVVDHWPPKPGCDPSCVIGWPQ